MMKILVGSFQCESNTFSDAKAGKDSFYILHGEEAKNKLFASHLFEEKGYEVVPLVYAVSLPSGMVTRECFDEVLADFKAHYAAHCAEKTHPYPGVTEVLAALRERGVKCAVVSNKGDFAVQMLAEKYFGGLLDMALGEREGIPRKPDPAPIRLIMEELGADPGSTVYIGDSEVDIVSADNAGLPHIICSWGFRERGFLIERGAKVMVDTADELLDAILH